MGFILHYARPFWPLLLASSLLSTTVALIEVSLFSFVGKIVDWLATADRETFWQTHSSRLIALSILVLVVLPFLKLLYEAVVHTGLLGNFAMRTRWQASHALRQSLEFFQNDFAGRVATKVMQTALGVRDTIMTATEVLLYVAIYFTGALFLFASSDLRLTAPLLLWLLGYVVTLYYFVPKLKGLAKEQADARSAVTGRIVDSYTNIATVKMFAHADREDNYAREGMEWFLDRVHAQMRLVTILTVLLNTMNSILLFSVSALSIWLWYIGAVTTGAIAFAIGLVLRLQGMSHWILWEVSSLFENIGTVQDGIETVASVRDIVDRADAQALSVTRGDIRYDNITFNYGSHKLEDCRGVIECLSLHIKPGEKVGIVGRSGAGKSTLVSLLLRFFDLDSGRILIDGQDISLVTQESLRAQIGMVTQDTSLLHRSVLDNIRYGKPEATFEEAVAAATKAHAHEFITGLQGSKWPHRLRSVCWRAGCQIVRRQRQRVAIAVFF